MPLKSFSKIQQSDECLVYKERCSNFDLLKILAMTMIVLFHYRGKWDYSGMGKYKVIMDVVRMFGELGVNLFALISGYFMIEQKNPFKGKKLFLMWMQVSFYAIFSTVIALKMDIIEIDFGRILHTIFPITFKVWWYASAYFILYFLAPFLNKGLKALEEKEYRKLIFILLFVFSICPTFAGIFNNNTETFFPYNRFLWIMILYCIAGYIRTYGICEKWTLASWCAIHIITWFFLIIFIIFMPENGISEYLEISNTYFWCPNSIVMVLLSVSLFMIFSKIKMNENRIISYIASCTFGIYLGHADRSFVIWNAIFHRDLVGVKATLVNMMCACTCIVMAILLIEVVRKQVEKLVAKLYDVILGH